MTKDNWIKEFRGVFGQLNDSGSATIYKPYLDDLEKFISQVEKDAIEKTNKRWRRKVQKSIDSLVLDYDGNNEEDKRISDISDGTLFVLEEKLSDLLEDKYGDE